MRHYSFVHFMLFSILFAGSLLALACAASPAHAVRERLDIVLLLDNSASMLKEENNKPGNDVNFIRLAALQYLVEKMHAGDRAALLTFDTGVNPDHYASRLHDLTQPGQKEAFRQGVQSIASQPRGATNMADGLRAAAAILRQEKRADCKRFLIFLTDGTPHSGQPGNTPAQLREYAAQLGREDIILHTIGLGELSSDPREAQAAQRLLEDMARAGKGASRRARHAEDLPRLFGSLFAQLAGHEISRLVPEGQQADIPLAQGTRDLRIIATREGQAPDAVLTDPQNADHRATALAPLLKEQTTTVSVIKAQAQAGLWHVRAVKGSLEVAYQPDFEAVLKSPADNSPVAAAAPFPVEVEVRQADGGSLPRSVYRALVEYEAVAGRPPVEVALQPDKSVAERFHGDIPDSGALGPHFLRVRCFRRDNGVEVEGGPAYETIQAGRLPVLSVEAPDAFAAFAVPGPIAVSARIKVTGKPLETALSGLTLGARWAAGAQAEQKPLLPAPQGRYTAAFIPSAVSAPISATLSVTLSGSFEGTKIMPQTVTLPLTITPHPLLTVQWKTPAQASVNSDGVLTFEAQVASSASTPQTLAFDLQNCPNAVLENATVLVSAHQARQTVPVRLRFHALAPGDYHPRLSERITQGEAELSASALQPAIHVRTWMERNRWWVLPLVLVLVLAVLTSLSAGYAWKREQQRRRRMKLALINRVNIYIIGSAQAFHPDYLDKERFTAGGAQGASDVYLWNPQSPENPLFPEVVLEMKAVWKHNKAMLIASPLGTFAALLDAEGSRVPKDLVLKEEINNFFLETGGRRTPLQVRRGITRTPRTPHEAQAAPAAANEHASSPPFPDTESA